jgi:hypothetical protein
MKIDILKITDRDDFNTDPMIYTIRGLRDDILNVWYDLWRIDDEEPPITKEQIAADDEKMFDYMVYFGYDVETILSVTEKDL